MIDKEITWRSVLAANNLKEIKEQFNQWAIPSHVRKISILLQAV
jgi:hypothetical protein